MARLPKLNTAAALTLVSVRVWVFAHLRGRPWRQRWMSGLETAGLPPAAIAAFDELLTVLAMFPDMFADVLPPCAHRVSHGELQLLELLAGNEGFLVAGQSRLGTAWPATVSRIVTERRHHYRTALAAVVGDIDLGLRMASGRQESTAMEETARVH